jgi:hypothetical protein
MESRAPDEVHQVTFWLCPSLFDQLRAAARDEDRSVSSYVRQLIKRHHRETEPPSPESDGAILRGRYIILRGPRRAPDQVHQVTVRLRWSLLEKLRALAWDELRSVPSQVFSLIKCQLREREGRPASKGAILRGREGSIGQRHDGPNRRGDPVTRQDGLGAKGANGKRPEERSVPGGNFELIVATSGSKESSGVDRPPQRGPRAGAAADSFPQW